MKDPYKTLGIKQGATKEEIKDSYKKMALKWHPDRHQDDPKAEEKFKEINAAYQLIKDGNYNPNQRREGFNPFQDISDIFNAAFNNGGSPFGNAWGQNVKRSNPIKQSELYISLQEARHGAKKKIRISSHDRCENCKGIGVEVLDETCSSCNGSGQVRKVVGPVNISSSCNVCRGLGKKIGNACKKCSGQGHVKKVEDLEIDIPAGVRFMSGIKPREDVIVQIKFKDDGGPIKLIDTNTGTVMSNLNVDLKTAVLGGFVPVQTLDGTKNVKINPGLQPNTNISIKNGGIGGLQGGVGAHIVAANIGGLPKELTDKQKKLFEKFYDSLGEDDGRKNQDD